MYSFVRYLLRQTDPSKKWTKRSVFTRWKLRGPDYSTIVKTNYEFSRHATTFGICRIQFLNPSIRCLQFWIAEKRTGFERKDGMMLYEDWRDLDESFPCLGTPWIKGSVAELIKMNRCYRWLGLNRERSHVLRCPYIWKKKCKDLFLKIQWNQTVCYLPI